MNNFRFDDTDSRKTIIIDGNRSVSLMNKVYIWMFLGLSITGITSYLSFTSNWVYNFNFYIWISIALVEVLMVWLFPRLINKLSLPVSTAIFVVYSILNGLTLSPIFAIYQINSIVTTFFISAGLFGAMAFIGITTKKDFSSVGRIMMFALIGIIIASVVNIFLHNTMLDLIISIVGVVLFLGLTIYDTQKIKRLASELDPYDENSQKLSLLGALTLYLDFINLFLFLLRLLGNRK